MAKCKECLHYEACSAFSKIINAAVDVEKGCEHFKDRTEVAEVVRCKDCVSYEERCPGFGYCYHWDYEQGMSPNQVDADDFCSFGGRRTDGKTD